MFTSVELFNIFIFFIDDCSLIKKITRRYDKGMREKNTLRVSIKTQICIYFSLERFLEHHNRINKLKTLRTGIYSIQSSKNKSRILIVPKFLVWMEWSQSHNKYNVFPISSQVSHLYAFCIKFLIITNV